LLGCSCENQQAACTAAAAEAKNHMFLGDQCVGPKRGGNELEHLKDKSVIFFLKVAQEVKINLSISI
jgi:hypothetical protein